MSNKDYTYPIHSGLNYQKDVQDFIEANYGKQKISNEKEAIRPLNAKWDIKDVDDYIAVATDLFENFLLTFTKENGLIRDITEDDIVDADECVYLYTDKGNRLAKKMRDMLVRIGDAHFCEDIEIGTYLYREY